MKLSELITKLQEIQKETNYMDPIVLVVDEINLITFRYIKVHKTEHKTPEVIIKIYE
jgi:hypothetical protein